MHCCSVALCYYNNVYVWNCGVLWQSGSVTVCPYVSVAVLQCYSVEFWQCGSVLVW